MRKMERFTFGTGRGLSWIVQFYVSAFDLHLQIYIGNRGLLASYDSAKWASVPSLMPLDIDSALLCAHLVT